MARRILVLDTSVLSCWLRIPGKDTAGPPGDRWDYARIQEKIELERVAGSTFVLPIPTLIETGNHIAQAPRDRYNLAKALCGHLADTADAATPWAAFGDQGKLWEPDQLRELSVEWPKQAARGLTIGDSCIARVARYYASAGFHVEILTGDAGLKEIEPPAPIATPRRRR